MSDRVPRTRGDVWTRGGVDRGRKGTRKRVKEGRGRNLTGHRSGSVLPLNTDQNLVEGDVGVPGGETGPGVLVDQSPEV